MPLLIILCTAPLDEARELYVSMRFRAVIELLSPIQHDLDREGSELLAGGISSGVLLWRWR